LLTGRARGPNARAALLTSIVTSGTTAFLIIMAMTFVLIRASRSSADRPRRHEKRHGRSMHRTTVQD
jgi:hypothetical protein